MRLYRSIGYIRVLPTDKPFAVSLRSHDFPTGNQAPEAFLVGERVPRPYRTPFVPDRRQSCSGTGYLSPSK